MKAQHPILQAWHLGLMALVLSASCGGEESVQMEPEAIAFTSVAEEQEMVTRSDVALVHDFTAYGYKSLAGGTRQLVIDGYAVAYLPASAATTADNTHDYAYVGGGQSLKYWDFAASSYDFWAYTGSKEHFQPGGYVLTIPDLHLANAEPADINEKLFSARYHREPVSSEVVRLTFKRPYARLRLLFYSTEDMSEDPITVENTTFAPTVPESITTEAKLTITYPTTGHAAESVVVTPTPGATLSALAFDAVTLDATHGTASNHAVAALPTGGKGTDYYVIPADYGEAFTLTTTINEEPKTATVPSSFMHWKPNTLYTYIFKITEAGRRIEFYDVHVDPWLYGGSQEEEWKNW